MSHEQIRDRDKDKSLVIFRWLGRLTVMAVILAIVSYFTPGFTINGLWSFLLAAVIINILDFLVEKTMKVDASPFGRGLAGFILSAIIIYVTQYFVAGMSVSVLGAVLGALGIGILDAIFPSRVM
jgi:uncharacterized membrane protein YvlD (DUF360 family)